MYMWAKQKQSAFTIVELLIVIVVIGILAAITIVAYNGIQTRARNGQVIAGVNVYYKAVLQYKTINSVYPSVTGCLGANYPGDQCWIGPNGTRVVSGSLDSALSEFIPTKPTLATSLIPIYTGTDSRAGAVYDSSVYRIVYYLQGAGQDCSVSGAVATTQGSQTVCIITLPS
jgi:prepilin-type N-terminal cleavage/methylation domain-containing protein